MRLYYCMYIIYDSYYKYYKFKISLDSLVYLKVNKTLKKKKTKIYLLQTFTALLFGKNQF